MKKITKVMTLALSGVIALSMVACGDPAPTASTAPASEEATPSETTDTAATTDEDALKVAIVTSPSGVDDGSFNQDNYNGVLSFVERNPSTVVTTIQEGDIANSINAVADVVADNDVIVTPGFQFSGISQLALDNPDKKFILVDAFPDPIGEQAVYDNIYSMMFAEEESGFFAGIAAALETTTGKVAVVNGIAYPSNVNYQFGFEAGVQYANKNLGTTAEVIELPTYAAADVNGVDVGGNYVGDFNDPSTGKVVGSALIDEGCDILFVAAGASGNGVFTAAKEAEGVKVIGCDVDQYDDGANGEENIVLTSALKVMGTNVDRSLQAVVDGTFKGENVVLHADTDSTGYVKAEGRHQLSPETLTILDEAYMKVKNKEITPPSNFNGYTPEEFPGL